MTRSNWFILGMSVLAASAGGYIEHRQRQPDASIIGQPSPVASLPDLNGKTQPLSAYRGHRVLLNFWASWCGPCLDEMPALDRAQARFGSGTPAAPGAIVVGIAMDDPTMARAFLAAHPPHYPILLGDLDEPSTTRRFGDITGVLPYSVLLGPDGGVMATHAGALSEKEIATWLNPSGRP
jgi:thiol-disulfide isomerase/thioredoxin